MEGSLGAWALCLVFIKLVTVGPTTRNFIIDTTLVFHRSRPGPLVEEQHEREVRKLCVH
jgi:hypothetical protein